MDFLDPALNAYSEAHTTPETPLLHRLNRETHLNVMKPRMLSGHLQGRTLAMFSQMLRPRRILEIGTYTGYSALCLAEGLTEDGVLHTIDVNDELEDMVRGYIAEAGLEQKIQLHLGQAADVIPTLDEVWDLVFIDADKKSNGLYYDLVLDKVRPGGFILIDNVLWSGKVVEKFRPRLDKDTELVLDFNRKVHEDPRVENLLLPIRDGILVARKK
ncbi:O-methyltransferase [Rufibacter glacialis]|uniref:O-methyltransferase n=1 Tax=Rufibacter glacialis TaxID=1259555 RepID=A0A5M8QHK1_9BACT|nr:O-methyltransferase [Rufibacter glacialis]KAA6435567.1 O-methyltransferase [Rufibacter glacialis]GGK64648.1 O-methyltransferase [Rufibacter glacialis]